MTRQEQIEAIHETAAATGGDVREEYSGRGMYGASCYAIDCDDPTAVIEEAASRGIRRSCEDQMGKGYIVYWPSIPTNEPEA